MTLDNVFTNPLPGDVGTEGVNGGDPGLQIRVTAGEPRGGAVKTGEVASARRDMLYGSFRAGLKYTGQNGTCGAFFFYYNDSQEIDFELLSKLYQDPAKAASLLLIIHAGPEVPKNDLFRPTPVDFRPADGYHEYRFDWTPERVRYYADGKFLWESTRGVPNHPGGLTLSHWSNGDPGWSAGPPAKDADMQFSYIKAYFNSSSDTSNKDYKRRCKDPSKADAICKVPDQTSPPDPNKSTWFLGPNKGLPGNNPPPAEPPPSTGLEPSEPPPPPASTPPSEKEVSPDNSFLTDSAAPTLLIAKILSVNPNLERAVGGYQKDPTQRIKRRIRQTEPRPRQQQMTERSRLLILGAAVERRAIHVLEVSMAIAVVRMGIVEMRRATVMTRIVRKSLGGVGAGRKISKRVELEGGVELRDKEDLGDEYM
ncbi:MAG: hypothetical protein Q9178_006022 [Gyalolechia marmorata]